MHESGYYPDLRMFSLNQLKKILEGIRLLTSQQILAEDLDERFSCIADHCIQNLDELQGALRTKADVERFAEATGLPINYLILLRREVNSYQPKPIKLVDFPGVKIQTVQKLDQQGIRNTRELFTKVLTPESRAELAKTYQIQDDEVLELTKLTDAARLKWVGPKFARLLVESDYDTVEKIEVPTRKTFTKH